MLHLPDPQSPFEIQMDVFHYVIGMVLKQGGQPVAYHLETSYDSKIFFITYEKYFYTLFQALKKCHNYILGKETILQNDHHLLIFINSHTSIYEKCHLKWVNFN
jgi:hypothetical protein